MLKELKQINERVRAEVPLVSWGGCAYYAALIRTRLAELSKEAKIGVIGGYTPPYGSTHVFTIVKDGEQEYFHDGENTSLIEDAEDYGICNFTVLDDDPISIVNNNRWNDAFVPNEDVPTLCSIIESVLGPFVSRPHFNTIQGVIV